MMQRIKTYRVFESQGLNEDQLALLETGVDGKWTLNANTGLIDVVGNVLFDRMDLEDLKGLRFGRVTGHFEVEKNQLQSCEGFPVFVGGDFVVFSNQLKDLVGAPAEVGGMYDVAMNGLESLEGSPKKVQGFSCDYNRLQSLKGGPEEVQRGFLCGYNQLKDLVGGPKKVGGRFSCVDNPMESLKGAPESLGGSFVSPFLSLIGGRWNLRGVMEEVREKLDADPALAQQISPLSLFQELPREWNGLDQPMKVTLMRHFPEKLDFIPADEKKLLKALVRAEDISSFL